MVLTLRTRRSAICLLVMPSLNQLGDASFLRSERAVRMVVALGCELDAAPLKLGCAHLAEWLSSESGGLGIPLLEMLYCGFSFARDGAGTGRNVFRIGML